MKPPPDVEFAAFAGIDRSDTKHDICLQAANSEERELAVVPHRPAAIDAWASALRQRFCQLDVEIGDTIRLPRNDVAEDQDSRLSGRLQTRDCTPMCEPATHNLAVVHSRK